MGIKVSHTDEIGSVLLLLLAAGIFVVTGDFPQGPGETGPDYYPRMIAVLIAFFALVQLGRSRYEDAARSHEIELPIAKRVIATLALIVVYVLLMPWLGFVTSTALFLVVAMRYSGVRSHLQMLAVAVGLTLILYYTFVVLLRIPLPESPLYPVSRYLPSLVAGVVV